MVEGKRDLINIAATVPESPEEIVKLMGGYILAEKRARVLRNMMIFLLERNLLKLEEVAAVAVHLSKEVAQSEKGFKIFLDQSTAMGHPEVTVEQFEKTMIEQNLEVVEWIVKGGES